MAQGTTTAQGVSQRGSGEATQALDQGPRTVQPADGEGHHHMTTNEGSSLPLTPDVIASIAAAVCQQIQQRQAPSAPFFRATAPSAPPPRRQAAAAAASDDEAPTGGEPSDHDEDDGGDADGGPERFGDAAGSAPVLRGIPLPADFPKWGTLRGLGRDNQPELRILGRIHKSAANIQRLCDADCDEETLRTEVSKYARAIAESASRRRTGLWVRANMASDVARFYDAIEAQPEIAAETAQRVDLAVRLAQGERQLQPSGRGGPGHFGGRGRGGSFGRGFAFGRRDFNGRRDDPFQGFAQRQQGRFPRAPRSSLGRSDGPAGKSTGGADAQ